MSRVTIVQTCDGEVYKSLQDLSETVNRRYAERHGYGYYRYDGVKRGGKPWHSSFNRIYLMLEMMDQGKYDWALYMDADAVVVDPTKPLDEFLMDDFAIVGCRGLSDEPNNYWELNAGVLFYNLRHPRLRWLLEQWRAMFEQVPLSMLNAEQDGCFSKAGNHIDDQTMLQTLLCNNRGLSFVFKGERHNAFNYGGPFIQQVLRNNGRPMSERLEAMRTLTNSLL